MSRAAWIGLTVGLALLAGAVWWFFGDRDASGETDSRPTAVDYRDPDAQADEAGEQPAPPPRYPLKETPAEQDPSEAVSLEPLPELEASDASVRADTTALSGAAPLEALLLPERLIQRFVVTFNSLDGRMAPLRKWPVRHAEGVPEVTRSGEGRFRWEPANQRRYDPYVQAFTTPDAATLVDLYIRYYPLLQEAYAALGEEEDYFNDRVIAIIDHLLAAPEAKRSYALRQPRVLFTFADPALERLSSGQKLLLRIGPEHSAAVRAQLRAVRAEIIARTGAEAEDASR